MPDLNAMAGARKMVSPSANNAINARRAQESMRAAAAVSVAARYYLPTDTSIADAVARMPAWDRAVFLDHTRRASELHVDADKHEVYQDTLRAVMREKEALVADALFVDALYRQTKLLDRAQRQLKPSRKRMEKITRWNDEISERRTGRLGDEICALIEDSPADERHPVHDVHGRLYDADNGCRSKNLAQTDVMEDVFNLLSARHRHTVQPCVIDAHVSIAAAPAPPAHVLRTDPIARAYESGSV